jgi:NTP pyrophosphatase (non-canonical NTP hydrolase)
MNFDDYSAAARSTAKYPGRFTLTGLVYCSLGLGEAGEVQGKVKKLIRDLRLPMSADLAHELTTYQLEDLLSELGDILWYISNAAEELGSNLNMVAHLNLDKLADRAARGVIPGSGDHR